MELGALLNNLLKNRLISSQLRNICFSSYSIGSLGDNAYEEGVENVTVSDSTISRAENGVRIKTWARSSNGFAKNINFQNIVIENAYNPIFIDQYYCPDHKGCPNQVIN